jgi:hypothetical protein
VKSKQQELSLNLKQKYIFVEGQRKDKLELEGIVSQVKHFFDHYYERNFILFPPMVKNPKNR